MYLEHFGFQSLPFILAPDTEFFCLLPGHREALETILFCLNSGEGFVKLVGEVGSGKTLLCRKLLDTLGSDYVTAWIPNPDLSPAELRRALARELGINPAETDDQQTLLEAINEKLLELHRIGKKVVLLVDEAQALPDESLEALRLLTNLETNSSKLLLVVLLGQPELDTKLNRPHLRQLKQRIGFSCYLPVLTRKELDFYLSHRLTVAGYEGLSLFTARARRILFRASRGVPRIVNILCHKALLLAWGKGDQSVSHRAMEAAIYDTESVQLSHGKFIAWVALILLVLTGLTFYWYNVRGII